jgi:acetyltransferase
LEKVSATGAWMEPEEVDAVLTAAGLRVPKSAVARSPEEAVGAASAIGGAVVIKVISESALHKSDVGGVVLGVEGEAEVRAAYEAVTKVVFDADGVLVQEFVAGGHEVLIGMTQDPNFGPLVGFGLGGVYVELLQDVAFRIHPLTDVDASEMIRDTKGFRLLQGYRNTAEGDVAKLEQALLRVSGLISVVPELVEMDLNPVKVLPPGEGVVVVDARMRIQPVPDTRHPRMRDLPGVR